MDFLKNTINKFSGILNVKKLSKIQILLNILSIILGILYFTPALGNLFFARVFGIVLLLTLIGNHVLIHKDTNLTNKTTSHGHILSKLGYYYLIFSIISIFIIIGANFLISITYQNKDLGLGYFLLSFGYFGMILLGLVLAYYNYTFSDDDETWVLNKNFNQVERSKKKNKHLNIQKNILRLISTCLIILLVYLSLLLIIPIVFGINWAIAMLLNTVPLLFGILLLSTTVLRLKLFNRKNKRKITFNSIKIMGIVGVIIFLLPFLLSPYYISTANENFTEAFGENWEDQISPEIEEYFLDSPLYLSKAFLAEVPKDCNVDEDILYFDGALSNFSVDKQIELRFDAFWPKVDTVNSPGSVDGKNSVLIRIHGGGWNGGGKGWTNYLQVNKYFASQGYVVFDIQYGLINRTSSWIPYVEEVRGNFTYDDQVRHIGNFIQLLNTSGFSKYNLNLDSVFVSGGSAGGHLTIATSLLYESGSYTNLFGNSITIKGIIPYYPGDPYEDWGTPEIADPEDYFIFENTMPCLIIQGTQDGCRFESRHIKEKYNDANNNNCALIEISSSGHSNDLIFGSVLNQIGLYYMERFMYLAAHDKIS